MRRTVWFLAGTAAGVYASARARRAAEALTVEGIHDRLTGWFAGAAVLREELRAGMQEKEGELRGRLQLGSPARAALAAPPSPAAAADPVPHPVATVRRLPRPDETGATG